MKLIIINGPNLNLLGIREKNIYISLRGETIRVSPHVYNNKKDLEKLFKIISKNS